jgi:hypothetical protein
MQTSSSNMQRPTATPACGTPRRVSTLLALPLSLLAACASMTDDTSTQTQALGPSCVVQRPYGWTESATCAESRFRRTPLTLAPGQDFTFFSAEFVGLGMGEVTITCDANGDGRWVEDPISCQ